MTLLSRRPRLPLVGLLLLAPALSARADVIRVAADGSGDYTLIQPAVDAAVDGDRIEVASGQYDSFVVDGTTLTVVGLTSDVQTGTVRVRNLAAQDTLTLVALQARGEPTASASSAAGMWFIGNDGSVRVHGCELTAGYGAPTGFPGLLVESSANVVLTDCSVVGGWGTSTAGPGLQATGSKLALYDVVFDGGGPASSDGVDGGHGGVLSSCSAWCAEVRFTGAQGSSGDQPTAIEGDGGDGLRLIADSRMYAQDCQFTAGPAGCAYGLFTFCGEDGEDLVVDPTSQLVPVATPRRELASNHPADLEVRGLQGDEVFLLDGASPIYELSAQWSGVLTVGVSGAGALGGASGPVAPPHPPGLPGRYLATIGASGTVHVTFDLAALLPDEPYGTLPVQVVVRSSGGQVVLSDPASVLLAPCGDSSADCDGNGVADLCELAAARASDCDGDGVLDRCEEDCDGNGLPDECEIRENPDLDFDGDGILDSCESQLPRLYVDADAAPGGDGSSWAQAFDDMAEALAAAPALPVPAQSMWVAEGTYRPAGATDVAFEVPGSLAVYGGFAGDEISLDQRDVAAHPTILSGDVLGDDGPGFANRGDNADIVVRLASAGGQRIDGFTIRGGHAEAGGTTGAGLRAFTVDPWVIANCTLIDNWAFGDGGGLWARSGGDIISCRFLGNRAATGGGARLRIHDQRVRFVNCEFSGNFCPNDDGAGLYVLDANDTAGVLVAQCTFAGNVCGGTTARGAGIFHGGLGTPRDPLEVRNCVLWGNIAPTPGVERSQIHTLPASTTVVSYTCIQGLFTIEGPGNHGLDPRFLAPLGADGAAGTTDDDLRLGPGSPAVDAGRNANLPADSQDVDGDGDIEELLPLDLAGDPRRVDDPAVPDTGLGASPLVDMGARERQP